MSDSYKRRYIAPDLYQCGCKWERQKEYGDVLILCPIHDAANKAEYEVFERKLKKNNWYK